MSRETYTVSQVASMAHVTVRTLHHYDEIGLLVPSQRTQAGYRLYSRADLSRLHQILLYRELGFSLEATGKLLDHSRHHRRSALLAQREHLTQQVDRTRAVIRAIDDTLASLDGQREMDSSTMFSGFDQFDHARYADEARERWGRSDSYRESARRTKAYSRKDWERLGAESGVILSRWIALMNEGRQPTDEVVLAVAEDHRLHLNQWFYACGHEKHALIAEGYVADPRFRAFYDGQRTGLAEFVSASIRANAARAA